LAARHKVRKSSRNDHEFCAKEKVLGGLKKPHAGGAKEGEPDHSMTGSRKRKKRKPE